MESYFLRRVLQAHPQKFGAALEMAGKLRLQILLSEVEEAGDGGRPCLLRHGFRVDEEYFYPASSIKLCAAVAALQKIKQIRRSTGVDLNPWTPLIFRPLMSEEQVQAEDPSNLNGNKITIAHEIRKLFLVSDNEAYNKLYEFVGQRCLNQAMWELGLQQLQLTHRLSKPMSESENRVCPAVEVFEPFDFSRKNYMSLNNLQDLLVKLFRRDVNLGSPPVELDEGMRLFLAEAMAQYPSQSSNPVYSRSTYPDDYCKFLLPGLMKVRQKGGFRIYNKIGRAFGFTIENAYVLDIETGRDFFLSAVVYTNANEILNDDMYEYSMADQLLADLGEVVTRAVWKIPPFCALRPLSTDHQHRVPDNNCCSQHAKCLHLHSSDVKTQCERDDLSDWLDTKPPAQEANCGAGKPVGTASTLPLTSPSLLKDTQSKKVAFAMVVTSNEPVAMSSHHSGNCIDASLCRSPSSSETIVEEKSACTDARSPWTSSPTRKGSDLEYRSVINSLKVDGRNSADSATNIVRSPCTNRKHSQGPADREAVLSRQLTICMQSCHIPGVPLENSGCHDLSIACLDLIVGKISAQHTHEQVDDDQVSATSWQEKGCVNKHVRLGGEHSSEVLQRESVRSELSVVSTPPPPPVAAAKRGKQLPDASPTMVFRTLINAVDSSVKEESSSGCGSSCQLTCPHGMGATISPGVKDDVSHADVPSVLGNDCNNNHSPLRHGKTSRSDKDGDDGMWCVLENKLAENGYRYFLDE